MSNFNAFVPLLEAVLRRLFKKTENQNNQPAKSVELLSFGSVGHEDMKTFILGMLPPGSILYHKPVLDVLMWTIVWISVAVHCSD